MSIAIAAAVLVIVGGGYYTFSAYQENQRIQEIKTEQARIEAEESKRIAEEMRKAEEAKRVAEEKRKREETARLAEKKRKTEEAARLAEEKRKADEAERIAEEKRKADEAARLAEEKRKAEENRANELAQIEAENRARARQAVSDCDQLTAHPDDPDKTPGTSAKFYLLQKKAHIAVNACRLALTAEPNNPRLQFQLGRAYVAKKENKQAVNYFRKASKQKYKAAIVSLGIMFRQGWGVEKDLKHAERLFRQGIELNSARGMYELGVLFGQVEEKEDFVKALKWYRRAADHGFPQALNNVGYMYAEGRGVEKSAIEAVKWFQRAAEKGERFGQFNLAVHLHDGTGIERDYIRAAKFWAAALKQGQKDALEQLTQSHANWSMEFRGELLKILKKEGAYSGPTDGTFLPPVFAAIRKYAGE